MKIKTFDVRTGNISYREFTKDEIDSLHDAQGKAEAQERTRTFTSEEVTAMLIKQQINTLDVDDRNAFRMREYYPEWESEKTYTVGYKVQYGGNLYKVITAHTSQVDWTPDAAATLFTRIDEIHDGTKYDPVPYDGNMALENGKYYVQDGITYLCTRDTINPVYNALADLVGLYVEKIEK